MGNREVRTRKVNLANLLTKRGIASFEEALEDVKQERCGTTLWFLDSDEMRLHDLDLPREENGDLKAFILHKDGSIIISQKEYEEKWITHIDFSKKKVIYDMKALVRDMIIKTGSMLKAMKPLEPYGILYNGENKFICVDEDSKFYKKVVVIKPVRS